jgi:hypothetical protein
MQRVLFLVAVLLVLAPALRPLTQACGDKFLMAGVGRGARFTHAYAAMYPATILVYTHGSSPDSSGILDPKFQATLTRAGHRVEVVNEEQLLARALQTGHVDLVLTDIANVEAIQATTDQSPSKPTILPVTHKPRKGEAPTITAKYQHELKTSDRPARYLSQIDNEMQARVKQRGTRKSS